MMNINALTSALARRCTISTSIAATSSHLATRANSSGSSSVEDTNPIANRMNADAAIPACMSPIASVRLNAIAENPAHLISRSMSSLSFRNLKTSLNTLKMDGYSQNMMNAKYNPTFLPSSPTSITQKRTFASKKHKRIIKMAKGYRGRANRTFRAAVRRVEKGLQYSYRDRKVKKRNMRKLWIEKINAGTRQHNMSYSRFINGMQKVRADEESEEQGIMLNRKVLADLAANEPFSFKAVVDVVKMKAESK